MGKNDAKQIDFTRKHEEDLRRLRGLRLLDDDFMQLRNLSICITNNDAAKSFFQICNVFRQTQNSHDFGSNSDVINRLDELEKASAAGDNTEEETERTARIKALLFAISL